MIDDIIIDFEFFTSEEVGLIYSFFRLIEETTSKRVNPLYLEEEYKRYRTIINSIRLEKKYDAMVKKAIGVSIYQTMVTLKRAK